MVEEVVTLGIIMVGKERKNISFKALVINVEKNVIEPLIVQTLERILDVIAEALWLVKELVKFPMNLKMVRTSCKK